MEDEFDQALSWFLSENKASIAKQREPLQRIEDPRQDRNFLVEPERPIVERTVEELARPLQAGVPEQARPSRVCKVYDEPVVEVQEEVEREAPVIQVQRKALPMPKPLFGFGDRVLR
jgi:hypothetical protein